jgi:metal-sulfur cluster biosynthetic enzyme
VQHDLIAGDIRAAVMACLENIVDPCSVASGVPAGLVSMGLVGLVTVAEGAGGATVGVTLYITEPGCLMGSLFELTARRALKEIPGVAEVEVAMDYTHVWGPEQMAPEYRKHLAQVRACRAAQMSAEFGETRERRKLA